MDKITTCKNGRGCKATPATPILLYRNRLSAYQEGHSALAWSAWLT